MLLVPRSTCWRTARAERVGLIVDVEPYYAFARAAMEKAERSIHLLGWAFDPDTPFTPTPRSEPAPEHWGPFLRVLSERKPELDIRLLVWKSALPVAATQNFFPHRARECFNGSRVHFRLDNSIPLGACHHQKAIVIDDQLAFCGGCDIGPDRWDTPLHHDEDPRRRKGQGFYDNRHETMAIMDGEAARALGQLFRDRWERSSGEILLPVLDGPMDEDLWPLGAPVDFRGATVGLARSEPRWRQFGEVRETERLHLASIAAAEKLIYMENQYFTSPIMAEALAARLEEADGPEIVLVSTQHSPSWFDRMTMDRTRQMFLKRLQESDRHGRLTALCPVTTEGKLIIVHSKLSIIDDTLVRIGSANLNNRSTGFDTECDFALEAHTETECAAIAAFRSRLVGHWIAHDGEAVALAQAERGALAPALAALDDPARPRLRPIEPQPIGRVASFIATYHIGDPAGPGDSWAPWLRRWALRKQLRRLAVELRRVGLQASADDLSNKTI